jgi:hypothetical protein
MTYDKKIRALRDKYTEVNRYRRVILKIGVQSFLIDGEYNKKEAAWMRLMLAKALDTLIKKETDGLPDPPADPKRASKKKGQLGFAKRMP